MPRYLLTIEYDGKSFVGWQRQRVGVSVQGSLERAVFQFCGQTAILHGAGRTDRGVHALGQRAHVDLDLSGYPTTTRSCEDTLRDAVNYHLRPLPLAISEVVRVGEDFHARFSAKRRSYLYRVVVSRPRPILREGRVWHRPLSAHVQGYLGARGLLERVPNMRACAARLLGEHDFSAFRAAGCQSPSPVKYMHSIDIACQEDEIRFTFCASGFLYRQVRLMVGTLVAIGEGRLQASVIDELLSLSSEQNRPLARSLTPTAAPVYGLYFAGVEY